MENITPFNNCWQHETGEMGKISSLDWLAGYKVKRNYGEK